MKIFPLIFLTAAFSLLSYSVHANSRDSHLYSPQTEGYIQKLLKKASPFVENETFFESLLRNPSKGYLGRALVDEFACEAIDSIIEVFDINSKFLGSEQKKMGFKDLPNYFTNYYAEKALQMGNCSRKLFQTMIQSNSLQVQSTALSKALLFGDEGFEALMHFVQDPKKFSMAGYIFFNSAFEYIKAKPPTSQLLSLSALAFRFAESPNQYVQSEATKLLLLIQPMLNSETEKLIPKKKFQLAIQSSQKDLGNSFWLLIPYMNPQDPIQMNILNQALQSDSSHLVSEVVQAWSASGLTPPDGTLRQMISQIRRLTTDNYASMATNYLVSKNIDTPTMKQMIYILNRYARKAQALNSTETLPQVLKWIEQSSNGREKLRALAHSPSQLIRERALERLDSEQPEEANILQQTLLLGTLRDALGASRALQNMRPIPSNFLTSILKSPHNASIISSLLEKNEEAFADDPNTEAFIQSSPALRTRYIDSAFSKLYLEEGYVRLPDKLFYKVLAATQISSAETYSVIDIVREACMGSSKSIPSWIRLISYSEKMDLKIQTLWHPLQRGLLLEALKNTPLRKSDPTYYFTKVEPLLCAHRQ